jgi:nucleoside-diphosphate-sugar epimerase
MNPAGRGLRRSACDGKTAVFSTHALDPPAKNQHNHAINRAMDAPGKLEGKEIGMSVFVTGGGGHLGGVLVRELLKQGRKVRVLTWRGHREPALEGLEVETVEGDVTDPDGLTEAMAGCEVVFHLAARISIVGPEGGLVHRINVDGVRNMVDACLANNIKRLVHFSSIHAFNQEPLHQPMDETRDLVNDQGYSYDHSKALGIAELRKGVAKGLSATIVNPSGVIGPLDFAPSRMGQVFLDLFHGKLPAVVEGGFTWVDARDVVAGALAAETKGRDGEMYLLSGHYHTVLEISKMVGEIIGKKTPTAVTPMWLARGVAPFALGWAKMTGSVPLFTPESLGALRANKVVLHDKAKDELGFNPRPVQETITDIFEWFKATGQI